MDLCGPTSRDETGTTWTGRLAAQMEMPSAAASSAIGSSEDRELAALRAGDERAFLLLVNRHHRAMVRVASLYVKSAATAEEVVQEAWLGVLRGLHLFEGRSSLKSHVRPPDAAGPGHHRQAHRGLRPPGDEGLAPAGVPGLEDGWGRERVRTAYKFLGPGAVSPFTGFRWPAAGTWVSAAGEEEASWIFACRSGDLPYWLDAELWRIELDGPIHERRYQIAAAQARLAGKIEAWDDPFRRRYARACATRARELALPALPPGLRERVARTEEPAEIAAAVRASAAGAAVAGYLGDAAAMVQRDSPASVSYIACILAASLGGGQPAFEAERAWQARWLSQHLGLDGA
jgi:hypothetical protein